MNERSLKALEGVNTNLVRIVERADELCNDAGLSFIITEGVRTLKRQRELFAAGATRTMKSRHLTGHAVDFAPVIAGQVSWKWPAFLPIAELFKQAANELNIPIVWGGDWKSFRDGPHIELDRQSYP